MNIHRITYNPETGSCSLYFIGCNFRCLCCYWKNIYPQVSLKTLRFLTLEEVMEALRPVSPRRVILISGDPVKNHEYSMLPETLFDEFGCEVRLMTNGYVLPSLEGLGQVSFSIKALDDMLHHRYAGRSNEVSLANFRLLYEKGVEISASSVLIPDLIDGEEIKRIARFIGAIDKDIPYRLIGYMPVDGFAYRRPTYAELEETAQRAGSHLANVVFSDPKEQDYAGITDLFTNHLKR